MASEELITFYDMASNPPLRTFAANPWKTRFALNYKRVAYRTEWIDMPGIASLRERLGLPANRTLPLLQDPHTETLLGDPFEIALYLEEAYPESPLFRPSTSGLTAAFNAHIDGLFTKFATLCSQMPFDPRIEEEVKAMFADGAASTSTNLQLSSEQRENLLLSFEAALGELAKAYRHTGGGTDYFWRPGGTENVQSQQPPSNRKSVGPFLDGDEPLYSDFIVGAWLKMMEATMPREEWQRVRMWQDGLWGRLVEALEPWSEIKVQGLVLVDLE